MPNLCWCYVFTMCVRLKSRKKFSWKHLPLTRTLKGFFLWFKPAVWWTTINCYHGFHALAKRGFFPRFSSTWRNMWAFKLFLQNFDDIFSTVLPFFSMSTVLLEPITLEINKINNDCIFLCICELKMSCREKKVMAFLSPQIWKFPGGAFPRTTLA